MKITANGIRYHIQMHSRDPSLPHLLLLHGFMGSGNAFGHLVDRLSEFANPCTLDLLGHGRTEGSDDPERFAVERQIDDLRLLLSELDLTDLFLHGYSMGGRLALRYALSFPDRLSGLILESTHSGLERVRARKERIRTDEERAEAITDDYEAFLEQWKQLPLFDNKIPVPGTLQERYNEMQLRQHPGYMAASLRGFGAGTLPSVKKELPRMDLPVLLLAGEKDEKYVTILSEMNDLTPNSELHIIEQAGHRIHIENPGAFVSEVKSFLQYCPTRR